MTSHPSVCVAISTMAHRLDQLEITLRSSVVEISQLDECIIICQGPLTSTAHVRARMSAIAGDLGISGIVRLEMYPESGLSRSRNRALDVCQADLLWVLDDDVRIRPGAIRALREAAAREGEVDVWVGRICCAHDDSKLYKNYPATLQVGRLGALRVSSIELVLSTAFTRRTGLRFDTRFGLGAELPSSEENLLLLDVLSQGGKVRRLQFAIVDHDCMNRPDASHWSRPEVAFAKGAVAREVGGLRGFAVLLRWLVRLMLRGLGVRDLAPLIHGYLRGRRSRDLGTERSS